MTAFPTTLWTRLGTARGAGGEVYKVLLEDVLQKYRPPIVRFMEIKGLDKATAEDLAQEVLTALWSDDVLKKADRARGRFRCLIIAICQHTISNHWRRAKRLKHGGNWKKLSLDSDDASSGLFKMEVSKTNRKDRAFDEVWCRQLLTLATDCLRDRCHASGKRFYEAWSLFFEEELTYAVVARRMRVKESDIRNYIHQARLVLRARIEEEIKKYSSSSIEHREDCAYLLGLFDRLNRQRDRREGGSGSARSSTGAPRS